MATGRPLFRGRPAGLDEENDENREDVSLFCGLALGEDDLVHEEEDHHRDAAVEHGGADAVDEVRHQQAGHRHPDAVDGVDDEVLRTLIHGSGLTLAIRLNEVVYNRTVTYC